MTEREAIDNLFYAKDFYTHELGDDNFAVVCEVLKNAVVELELYRMNDNSKRIPGAAAGSGEPGTGPSEPI